MTLKEKMDCVDWRRTGATDRWRRRNADKLAKPLNELEPEFISEAMTYCNSNSNIFSKELLSRAGLLDDFLSARGAIARTKVLERAADKFGIILF